MFSVRRGPWEEQTDIIEFRHLLSIVCKDWVPCSCSRNRGHFEEREERTQMEITLRAWAFLDMVSSHHTLVEGPGENGPVRRPSEAVYHSRITAEVGGRMQARGP